MDAKERLVAQYVLLQMQNHALHAQVALGERTRAEFRVDAQVQAAVIERLNSLSEFGLQLSKAWKSRLRTDQLMQAAGLATSINIPCEGPSLKKVYNFVHQGLPILVAIIDQQLELLKPELEQDES